MKNLINRILELLYPPFKRLMNFSVFAYLSLGAVNTVLNIALFALFYQIILIKSEYLIFDRPIESYTISLVYAFLLTIPSGYWLAKHFAFKTENSASTASSFIKYSMVVTQGLISDFLLMKLMIEVMDIHPTIAKVNSTVIVLTANYILQKYFTFKSATN